jgi:hypothetical protein
MPHAKEQIMKQAIGAGVGAMLLCLAAGCGSAGDMTEVTGTVRLEGQPLKSGEVTFVGADGTKSFSAISETGVYHVQGVKRGKAQISVVSKARVPAGLRKPGPGAAAGASKEEPIAIPEHYTRPESSGLTLQIDSRKQLHDIHLTRKP